MAVCLFAGEGFGSGLDVARDHLRSLVGPLKAGDGNSAPVENDILRIYAAMIDAVSEEASAATLAATLLTAQEMEMCANRPERGVIFNLMIFNRIFD